MQTTIAHLTSLLFCGRLNGELLHSYQDYVGANRDGSAHSFIVKHCFLRAPSPDVQHHSDVMLSRFERCDPAERGPLFFRQKTAVHIPYSYDLLDIPENSLSTDQILLQGVEFHSQSAETLSYDEERNPTQVHLDFSTSVRPTSMKWTCYTSFITVMTLEMPLEPVI